MSAQPREQSDEISSSDEGDEGHDGKRMRITESDQDERERPKKKSKTDKRSRHWFATWNNYVPESIAILLDLGAEAYAFQEEKSSTGTKHIQGVFSFKNARLWSTLDRKCKSKCYWEVCKNVQAARRYCQKDRTRIGKRWTEKYGLGKKAIIDPLDGKTPYTWQRKIIDMINLPPDDRKIYWYWSTRGAIGKSALVKHLCIKEDASYVGGKFSDAFYAIKAKIDKGQEPYIILFDLPKSMGNRISYVAIEGIKNGLIFNSKYESGQIIFNTPHIIVFANCEPDYNMLSQDRWQVKCLDDEIDIIGTLVYSCTQ